MICSCTQENGYVISLCGAHYAVLRRYEEHREREQKDGVEISIAKISQILNIPVEQARLLCIHLLTALARVR